MEEAARRGEQVCDKYPGGKRTEAGTEAGMAIMDHYNRRDYRRPERASMDDRISPCRNDGMGNPGHHTLPENSTRETNLTAPLNRDRCRGEDKWRVVAMRANKPSKRKKFADAKVWLLHRLQLLPARRFEQVINKILSGEHEVISVLPESEFERLYTRYYGRIRRKTEK